MISVNDTAAIPFDGLELVYDHAEFTYQQYKKSKDIDYQLSSDPQLKESIVRVHNESKLKISKIKLTSEDDFNRSYQVYASDEEGERIQQIADGSIYKLNLEEIQIQDLDIPLGQAREGYTGPEYIEIVIKDQDDRPLNIDKVQIEYDIDKIVFKSSEEEGVHLLFGNDLATKPSYDISAYIKEMENSKQESAHLLGLVEREIVELEEDKAFDFSLVFNIAVLMISGLLAVVILRKK